MMQPDSLTADLLLEQRIDHEAFLLHTVRTPEEQRMVWEKLKQLIAQRSPAQISRMESQIL